MLVNVDDEEEMRSEAKKAIAKVVCNVKHANVGDEYIHAEKFLAGASSLERNSKRVAEAVKDISQSCLPDSPI